MKGIERVQPVIDKAPSDTPLNISEPASMVVVLGRHPCGLIISIYFCQASPGYCWGGGGNLTMDAVEIKIEKTPLSGKKVFKKCFMCNKIFIKSQLLRFVNVLNKKCMIILHLYAALNILRFNLKRLGGLDNKDGDVPLPYSGVCTSRFIWEVVHYYFTTHHHASISCII